MKYRVIRKQENSKMCLVCGIENNLGLKASFYEMENENLAAIFKPLDEHQSYPGILHGGMISAILDETIGRAFLIKSPEIWCVTMELNITYIKPVPLDKKITVISRIIHEDENYVEGTGEVILLNGKIAAKGYGKFKKLSISKISNFEINTLGWEVLSSESDPLEIEY